MDRQKFYVSVESGEISEAKAGNNDDFVIYGNPDEIIALRECFDDLKDAEDATAIRATLPFKEYHQDEENDAYDYLLMKGYKMLYNLGDHETKEHIESMPFFNQFERIDDE